MKKLKVGRKIKGVFTRVWLEMNNSRYLRGITIEEAYVVCKDVIKFPTITCNECLQIINDGVEEAWACNNKKCFNYHRVYLEFGRYCTALTITDACNINYYKNYIIHKKEPIRPLFTDKFTLGKKEGQP